MKLKKAFFVCSFATLFSLEAEGQQKQRGSSQRENRSSGGGGPGRPDGGPPGVRGLRDLPDGGAHSESSCQVISSMLANSSKLQCHWYEYSPTKNEVCFAIECLAFSVAFSVRESHAVCKHHVQVYAVSRCPGGCGG